MSSDQGALPYVAPGPPPVGPTLVSIAVTPASPTLATAATLQFVATGTYSDTSVADVTSTSTWGSATPAKATISAGGLATGVATGTSVISATIAAVSGNTTLTIASTGGGGEPGPTPVPPIPPSAPPAPPQSGLIATYFSPTTPTATSFTVDVTGAIRLGSITGLVAEAEMGAVGEGSQVFDDPDGTLGHDSDGIVGLKQMYFDETNCPPGQQRLWTGYTGDRRYHRGQSEPSGSPSSLILGVARQVDVTLVDVNSFASFRVFAPTADDPTSDFVRPAETDIERITALLTTVDFLSDTLFDDGYINTSGPVNLDANDYTGSRPADVLNDCSQMSGKNYFIRFNETTQHYMLWYDFFSSDGSSTTVFDSPLLLTNVLAEYNGTTIFAIEPDAVGVLDPSRVVSAIRGTGTGVTGYETLASTANTFAWRDGSPISSSVKTQAKMDALLTRYLADNATEDYRISCTVRLPNTVVTLLQEGMRVQVHFTHLPQVNNSFTWCRVLQRTIRQDVETFDWYWLDLELTPGLVAPAVVQYYTVSYNLGGCLTSRWNDPPGGGNLLIGFAVQRGDPGGYLAGCEPIGNTNPVGTCYSPNDIPGTEWTFENGLKTNDGGAPGFVSYPVSLAWRNSVVGEPQTTRWSTPGQGTRVHMYEVAGLSGAPTVTSTANDLSTGGSSFRSPDITVGAAGFIFWCIVYSASGPSDGASSFFTLTARAPAVGLLQGYAGTEPADMFAAKSYSGYLQVSAGGTYHVVVDRDVVPRNPDYAYAWDMAFWPS